MIRESNTIAASEILLEELAADIARVSAVGAKAFTAGEFELAAQLLDKARGLTSLLADLQAMSARVQSALADVSEHLDLDLPETTTLREPAPTGVLADITPPS